MRKISSGKLILSLFIIYSIIYFVCFKDFGKVIKNLNQKLTNNNFCEIGNNFNDDIIELLTTATKLNIKLTIVEPQRLVQYLSEKELVLFIKSDNSFNFERSFSPNKIIFGVFESDFNSSQTVRLLLIKTNIRSNFMSFEIILNFAHNFFFFNKSKSFI